MREAGFSHKSLARAVVVSAGRQGAEITCDHTYVTRWLKGSVPRGDMPRHIADAMSRKLGRRVAIDDIGMGSALVSAMPADLGLDFAEEPHAAISTAGDLWRADLADAEALTRALPDNAASSEASLRWLVSPPDGALMRNGSRSVGASDIAMIRGTAEAFSTLDGKFGGGHARRALIQYLHSDVRPMLDGKYSDTVGRELFSAVAESLLLAGWMSYDSGSHGIAQRYFIQALRMAHAADDRHFGSSVLSAMSHQATFLGRYREGLTLARAALAPAASLTPVLSAQFHAMEARALSRLGDARGCDLALTAAEHGLASRTDGGDPAYIAYFDEVELAAEASHCFRDLGRPDTYGASSVFGDGMNVRSDFFATTVRAEIHITQGELDEGLTVTLEALRLGEGLKSARCGQYIQELQTRLTGGMTNAAAYRQFAEEAAGYRLWRNRADR
jgi:hypothetical protein